jgi:hypothetical protein
LREKEMDKNLTLNLKLFRYSEDMLYEYLYSKFKEKFDRARVIRDKDKTYLFIDNKAKILVVSHLDVVYQWNKYGNNEVYVVDNKYLWSPLGIGGDDRAGVQIIYWLSKSEYRNKINYLFTKGEERGCIGANRFNADYKGKLDIFAMIEFDREGNDFVMYRYRDKQWEEYISRITKRKAGVGSISDISHLDMGVRGVNIGIGYYHNHMGSAEFVVIDLMKRAYSDGIALINDILNKGKKWEYKEERRYFFGYYDWDYDFGYGRYGRNLREDINIRSYYTWFRYKETNNCAYCGTYADIFVSDEDLNNMCLNCIVDNDYDIIFFNDYDTLGYCDGYCMICGKKDKVYISTRDMILSCKDCDKSIVDNLYKRINKIRVKTKGRGLI